MSSSAFGRRLPEGRVRRPFGRIEPMTILAGLILLGTVERSTDSPVLRVLLHLVDRGWPEKGAIVIPYPTPRGRSFQVSQSDHRAKGLRDVRQSDVVFRMHFDRRNTSLAVEDESPRPHKLSTEPSAAEKRTALRRLASLYRIDPWFINGADVGIHATQRGYLIGHSSLRRTAGDSTVIVLSKDGRNQYNIRGY